MKVVLSAAAAMVGFIAISGCDALDDCLDAGGGWDDELDRCICTDQERKKFGDVSKNDAIEMCVAEYESLKAQKENGT